MNVAPAPAVRLACIAALAAAALLTACSTGPAHPSADSESASRLQPSPSHVAQFLPPSSPAAISTTPAASRTTPTTPAASPPEQLAAGPGPCGTGDLRLAVGPANGAAGSIYYPLLLTNTSASACTLYGYPGVAFVTGPGGSVIGGPAVRNPTFPKQLVTLAPGAASHASLQVAIAANYPAAECKPVTAHWLQVFPPGQYAALYVGFTAPTCTGTIPSGSTLGIYVVRPGVTGP